MIRKRAQSTLEYTMMITVILGALLVMGVYFKRGLQGRWKTAVDDVGEQYDPVMFNGTVEFSMNAYQQSLIETIPDGTSGVWTLRTDSGNTIETKSGRTTVGTGP